MNDAAPVTGFDPGLDAGAVDALVHGRHGDPFAVLGPHETAAGWTIRALVPDARAVTVLDRTGQSVLGALHRVHPDGLFSGTIAARQPYLLRIDTGDAERVTEDPYAFPPVLGDIDVYLLAEGRHQDLGNVLGAHATTMEGVRGVSFAVWAPNARRVSVVGDFNRWDGRAHPTRHRFECGVWELFIPRLTPGTLYKYELLGPAGDVLPLKADPFAWAAESPPATASIVADPHPVRWTDAAWREERGARQTPDAPISVYEVHAPSWMPGAAGSWDALAERLVPYVARMGFTHVEFLPVMEHPFGGSWGYQPLGQFAPMARLGPPDAFARLVDRCHAAGLGVLLDWVPAHFPTDAHGLARFDGTPLYEHADPREGFHRDWNTYIFNLGRNEVRSYLFASALHWLEHYHADGLRVDAVASMLYRDYSRPAGEWVPNKYGGRENLEAISFLQDLSRFVRARSPGAILVAEESTAWPGVTRSPDEGGLGFSYKWNMGWMHDTLHYMSENPVHRRYHHDNLTFGLIYAFSERFILPLSHDEVVHGKRSLLGRMPGDEWQRFANLRAYFGFMWTHPGKKLLFMGGEFGQEREWSHDWGLDWFVLDRPMHVGVQTLVRDLNRTYRENPALHRKDCESDGFRWVVIDDRDQSVFAYLRFGNPGDPPILAVCNFTPVPRYGYRVGVPQGGAWHEILNSDAAIYGGSGLGNGGVVSGSDVASHGLPASLDLLLPPLATLVLRPA
ncbi:MAG: 1,4-alpha-glucan branching protein GlgB [Alphaproteobacteria bacterium]|nr:1,4-alpha-glucan branching protein GlgB [Alphaproteobacteria bacterium]